MSRDKTLSIVFLSYFSGDRVHRCYDKLGSLLEHEGIPFEFVVMDDGSKDESYRQARLLEKAHANVRAYRLSRNFGSNYSFFAGLSKCEGSCVMPMVDDEQQPYETVVALYRLWENGHKVVIPCREDRADSKISSFLSNIFYAIMNRLSEVRYPPGGADLFLVDREVANILNTRIHPRNTSCIAEVLRLGFDPYFYKYKRPLGLNKNKSRWTFGKKWRLAKDNFFSASTFPIRLIAFMGVVAFFFSLLAGLFYVYAMLFGNRKFWGLTVPGWVSIVVLIFAFGGLILLSLSMLAEYVWRIYDEVKARPGYIIRSKDGEDEDGVA